MELAMESRECSLLLIAARQMTALTVRIDCLQFGCSNVVDAFVWPRRQFLASFEADNDVDDEST
jgi:hypothetical protein